MKLIIPASIILLILVVCLPLIFMSSSPPEMETDTAEASPTAEVQSGSGEAGEEISPHPTGTPSAPPENTPGSDGTLDKSMVVNALIENQVTEIAMSDYLVGVVAAEMPVTFEMEALKAQSVAARTYTLYKKLVAPSSSHPDADVCDDYTCCKAFSSDTKLQEQWKENYESYRETIVSSVLATDGSILTYDSQPILAAFHSSSSGSTEASADIWGGLPYLQSVRTFEDPETVPNFYTSVELTFDEFKSSILALYVEANLEDEDAQSWITDIQRSQSGRLSSITVGGVSISGADFRSMFSLRSTNISIEFGDAGLTLTTSGYGHGVGMSQYGANYLATMGLDYAHILSWYYTDVTLTTFDTLG